MDLEQMQAMANVLKNVEEKTAEKRPSATMYINIGVDVEGTKVNLPFNLALDTMPYAEVKGSAEWRAKVKARNMFLDMLRETVSNIPAGEEVPLPILQVSGYRVQSGDVVTAEDQVLTSALGKLKLI